MAWKFRKRIKVIPGVHLNLSLKGISTSIGVRGANLTVGSSGTYLNTGIPGTGLYSRQKLSNSNNNQEQGNSQHHYPSEELSSNIFSADIQEITSQNMQGIKESILMASQQREDLKKDLAKVKLVLFLSKLKLFASYLFVLGFVIKSISEEIKKDIESQKQAIEQIKEAIENSYVDLEIDFDPEIQAKYDQLLSSFERLISSEKIWDITSEYMQDRSRTRSAAGALIKRREVKFGVKQIADVKSKHKSLWFQNANGADLYFYPNFILMYSSKKQFAVIGLDEIEFHQSYTSFLETGHIPKDTKITGQTWAKVNKNGTPDRRFKGNYQIPIVKYGMVTLKTRTGLNEEYQFSNYEHTASFGRAFQTYQTLIKGLKELEN